MIFNLGLVFADFLLEQFLIHAIPMIAAQCGSLKSLDYTLALNDDRDRSRFSMFHFVETFCGECVSFRCTWALCTSALEYFDSCSFILSAQHQSN